jgi:hemerythrin superfamily protein
MDVLSGVSGGERKRRLRRALARLADAPVPPPPAWLAFDQGVTLMDAIRVLLRQHRAVEKLFQKFEEEDDLDEKRVICREISDALAIHATIEEKLFYPATKDARTEDLLLEAVEEHLAAKRIIADLVEQEDLDEAHLDARVSVLKEQVQHHVREEEFQLFPKVKKVLTARELDRLGDQLDEMSAELKAQGAPRMQVPAQTDEPAPI